MYNILKYSFSHVIIVILCIRSIAFSQNVELAVQTGHYSDINYLCYNSDGTLLASADISGTVIIWNIPVSRQMMSFHTGGIISSIMFTSANDKLIVGLESGELIVGNIVESSFKIIEKTKSSVLSLCMTNDSDIIMAAADNIYSVNVKNNSVSTFINGKYQNVYFEKQLGLYRLMNYMGVQSIADDKGVINKESISFLPRNKRLSKVLYFNNYKNLITLNTFRLMLFETATGKKLASTVSTYMDENFTSVVFAPSQNLIIASNTDSKIYLLNPRDLKTIKKLSGHLSDVLCMSVAPDSNFMASAGKDRSIIIWDMKKMKLTKRFFARAYALRSLGISKSNTKLAIGNEFGFIKTIDMLSPSLNLKNISLCKLPVCGISFIDNDNKIISIDNNDKISLINENDFKLENQFTFTHSFKPASMLARFMQKLGMYVNPLIRPLSFDISNDEKFIIVNGTETVLRTKYSSFDYPVSAKIYSLPRLTKKEVLRKSRVIYKSKKGLPKFASPDHILKSLPSELKLWKNYSLIPADYYHYKRIKAIELFTDFRFKTSDTIAFRRDSSLILFDLKNNNELYTIKEDNYISTFKFTKPGRQLVYSYGQKIVIYDVINKTSKILLGHNSVITGIDIINEKNQLISASADGTVKFWDIAKETLISTLICFDKTKRMLITADNYYYAPIENLCGVGFKVGNKLFPPEQFDLKFNRPDIVFDRLGFISKELISAYRQAYLKRLKRMNFTEEMLSGEMQIPEIEILNKEKINLITDNSEFQINVVANDKKYLLNRLNVWINNIPVYGINGIDLSQNKAFTINKNVILNLIPGINKIQVSCMNEKAVESLRETIEIEYLSKKNKPDLFIVAIGVSKYMNSEFNLNYASKDAKDIVSVFYKSNFYNKKNFLLLTDTVALRSNILTARDFLMKSKPGDVAMIFYAGHGLIDENLNYYFATHETDFFKPSENSIQYDELENLIDGIPALKRLIMIDACHSGEIDKEETVIADAETNFINSNVKFRGFKVLQNKKNALGLMNSFELMQELFTDIRRGTGAEVISSAGGKEFSFESGNWKNGVFTYSLIEGIQSGNADINSDNEITLSELKNYVFKKVKDLTGGKQNPTMRKENSEFDFRVW